MRGGFADGVGLRVGEALAISLTDGSVLVAIALDSVADVCELQPVKVPRLKASTAKEAIAVEPRKRTFMVLSILFATGSLLA